MTILVAWPSRSAILCWKGSLVLHLPDDLSDLFSIAADGSVSSRESKHLEFKEGFAESDFSDYTRALAAFSNADGGTIVFGVTDKPRRIVNAGEPLDEAKWVDRLREDFDPEIHFAIRRYSFKGKILYAVGVDTARYKPVIARKNRTRVVERNGKKKDLEVLREGTVYYRYAGQSRFIAYAEMHNLLAQRDHLNFKRLTETLQLMQTVGIANTGVVDLSLKRSRVYMSKETAKGLSFIDKGRLVEDAGSPAYVVMGNVEIQDVIHAPLQDEDKNIPTEAAKLLAPTVKEIYGGVTAISPQQVTALLRHLKIDGDNVHSVHEKKLNRKYVTREGLKALDNFIRANPGGALRVFGSRAALALYNI